MRAMPASWWKVISKAMEAAPARSIDVLTAAVRAGVSQRVAQAAMDEACALGLYVRERLPGKSRWTKGMTLRYHPRVQGYFGFKVKR